MANSEAQATPESAARQSKAGGVLKWVLISVGMFVIVTLSQAVAPILTQPLMAKLSHGPADAHAESEKKAAPLAEPLYAPLNPPMVVNFSNDPSGFLQVEIQLMARDKAIISAIKANEPAVRNALLMLFAGKTRDDVTTREGKEKLREEALSEVQEVLRPYTKDANVEDVYFTSLIAQ